MLEGEGDRVLQTRGKRCGDLTQASLLSAGGQQDREIDIDRQARLAPALDGDATDDDVGDVAVGEETMQLPGRFELSVHRLPASRRRSATRCSMAWRSSAAPRSRGRACHICTRRSYWARASAMLSVRSSRSLSSRRMAWPRRSRCRWSWTLPRVECMTSAFYGARPRGGARCHLRYPREGSALRTECYGSSAETGIAAARTPSNVSAAGGRRRSTEA